jgi:inorganic pyrophosphatase
MSVNYIHEIDQLPPHTTIEMRRFFEDYKKLENKEVRVEMFQDKKAALQIVQDAILLYQKTFG